jgi:integrase/recombinase XerD
VLFTDTRQLFAAPTLSEAAQLAAVNSAGIPDITADTRRWLTYAMTRLARSIGDCRVDELTPAILYEWHRELAVASSAVTANSLLRAVAVVCARLVERGVLAASPARAVPYLPEPRRRPKAVSEDTYLAMRRAASCTRDRALLDALWATGCRVGGILSMSLPELEFWTVNGETRLAALVTEKFGASRYVYARAPQADAIRAWLAERPAVAHDALWTTLARRPGQPLTRMGLEHALRRLRLTAEIPNGEPANAHAFRHAYAIRQLDAGHDLAAVAAWLGHSDPAFTAKVYANRREDELRRKYFGD